jgi:hypothetical protein
MEWDSKNIGIAALVVGALVVVLLMRGGASGSQVSTLAALPPGDSGDRSAAFSDLIGLGRAELEYNRDLALGRIQGTVESYRINAALLAEYEQGRTQRYMAQQQASSQQSSDVFGFLTQVASVALPLVL